jgi:hypothetical protein
MSEKADSYDDCQTPPYAFDMLAPYIPPYSRIWEPAAGEGYLAWAMSVHWNDYKVVATDVRDRRQESFLSECYRPCDYIVTNPPYSRRKNEAFILRALALEKPFAFLMRWRMMGSQWGWKILKEMDAQILVPDIRINFKMPLVKSWQNTSASFKACWFLHGFNLKRDITYVELKRRPVLPIEPYWYRELLKL